MCEKDVLNSQGLSGNFPVFVGSSLPPFFFRPCPSPDFPPHAQSQSAKSMSVTSEEEGRGACGWGEAAGGGEELSRTAWSPLAGNLLAEVHVVCLCLQAGGGSQAALALSPASPQNTHTHTHSKA